MNISVVPCPQTSSTPTYPATRRDESEAEVSTARPVNTLSRVKPNASPVPRRHGRVAEKNRYAAMTATADQLVDSRALPGNARKVPSDAPPPPRERDDRDRGRLDRMVPDLVRKLVDAGVEKLADGPESLKQVLSELRLPKEAIQLLVSQLEDAKREVTRVLAREVRDFLERASLADELTKLLSGLTLEVKTQIRFVPNEDATGGLRPRFKAKVGVQTTSEPAPAASDSTQPGSQPVSAPIRQPSSAPCASDGAATEQERHK